MEIRLVALGLVLSLLGCGGGPGTTPNSVASTQYCVGSTCHVTFDDGVQGITVQNYWQNYVCRGQGL